MAKVIITVEDNPDNDHEVMVSWSTEPEYKENDPLTLAQAVALKFNAVLEEMRDTEESEEKETE